LRSSFIKERGWIKAKLLFLFFGYDPERLKFNLKSGGGQGKFGLTVDQFLNSSLIQAGGREAH
jgi:hypothetical protein